MDEVVNPFGSNLQPSSEESKEEFANPFGSGMELNTEEPKEVITEDDLTPVEEEVIPFFIEPVEVPKLIISNKAKDEIRAALKDSGADSMSQLKAFDRIIEALEN